MSAPPLAKLECADCGDAFQYTRTRAKAEPETPLCPSCAAYRRGLADRAAEVDALRRALADVARCECEAWRSMDSDPPPMDGTPLLLCNAVNADGEPIEPRTIGDVFCQVASWWQGEDSGRGRWVVYCSMVQDPYLHFEPTHWRPLLPLLPDGGAAKYAVEIKPAELLRATARTKHILAAQSRIEQIKAGVQELEKLVADWDAIDLLDKERGRCRE